MSAVLEPQATAISAEEFLAWERGQPGRHELIGGEVHAMVGASLAHTRIVGNLFKIFDDAVDAERCAVFLDGAKLRLGEHVFYPDLLVTCEDYDLEGDSLVAPTLIVEVLSPSTHGYDRGAKWAFYQRLASLETFVLVAQHVAWVQVFRRSGDGWDYSSHTGMDDVIAVVHPRCEIRVADVYRRVPARAL